MEKISAQNHIFKSILADYCKTQQFLGSRIRQDLNNENSTRLDYKGREIYELLQNAEDAQADKVEIKLDTNERLLSISNMGKDCVPFSAEGFGSIMMAGTSPKQLSKQSYIGNKGLGFRSILNWADVICIHSNGVRCEFSSKIVSDRWENIIKKNLSDSVVKEHEEFAKKLGVDHPMAILAIPEVTEENDNSYTTKVDIKYKPECLNSIKDQVASLSGKVLLFLSNIHEIIIDVDGDKYSIRKDIQANSEKLVKVYDNNHKEGIEYIIHKVANPYPGDDTKCYEVCLAYTKEEDKCGDYLYTFFPTKVRIGLPCVVHATFELNSSRNALIESETNNWMQAEIARCLKEFANELAADDNVCSWNYFDLVSLNEYDQRDFPDLYNELLRNREALCIYPTYDGYKSLDMTVRYSSDFAKFVENNSVFKNHLLEGFERYFEMQYADDSFVDAINEFSKQNQSIDISKRVELIYAISTIKYSGDNQYNFLVLLDSSGNLINNGARINVGEEITNLPNDLSISYVHKDLVSALLKRFGLDDGNVRGVTSKLSSFCADVKNFDISAAKDSIITYLKSANLNKDGFVQLMFALFNKLQVCEEDSSSLRELFQRLDFKVLAKDGNTYSPCEVVISQEDFYLDNERLIYSPSEWVGIFSDKLGRNISEEDVLDFFCETVGVARHIPMSYTPLDNKADEYLEKYSNVLYRQIWDHNRFYYEQLQKYHGYLNCFHIVKPEFIDRLYREGKSISFIIKLIINDDIAFGELKNTSLHYSFRTNKSEEVKVSYPLYILRGIAAFKQLSTYITSENILLDGDLKLENELNELCKDFKAKDLLIMIGARENIGELELEDLYNLLYKLPEKNLKSGVQRLYKSIREAIKSKEDNPEFKELSEKFAINGTAYCRKNGGTLEIKPVNEIYYWDNVSLPQNILIHKHKLELPTRVGEESVKSIFGVKLAKDIVIEIGQHIKNVSLSEQTMRRIRERIRYILAYRLNTSEISNLKDKKNIVQVLRNIDVQVYASCSISIGGAVSELHDGDMVSNKINGDTVFHVCTGMTEIDAAFKTPSFCESITEILCISLKVTGNEIANCFRSILKNSIAENEFISRKEISSDIWEEVDKLMGLSQEEKNFWDMITKAYGVQPLNPDKLTSASKIKIDYIKQSFKNIVLPDHYTEFTQLSWRDKYALLSSLSTQGINLDLSILGEDGIYPFYYEWIKNRVDEYKADFARNVYEITVTDKDKHPYWYYDQCSMFNTGDWKFNQLKEHSGHLLTTDGLDSILKENIKSSFDYLSVELVTGSHWCGNIKDSYLQILAEFHLNASNISQRDLSLTIFDGYENEFRELVDTRDKLEMNNNTDSCNIDTIPVAFSFGIAKNKIQSDNETTHKKAKTSSNNGKYTSERQKYKAGLEAENKVISYLESNSDKFYSRRCSRNLDITNGDDASHYDIIYAKIENGIQEEERYLEVKSMSSDTILMSKHEYDFATKKENADKYDLAIVRNNSITIIRAPFAEDNDGKSKLQVITETYKITMDIDVLPGE